MQDRISLRFFLFRLFNFINARINVRSCFAVFFLFVLFLVKRSLYDIENKKREQNSNLVVLYNCKI